MHSDNDPSLRKIIEEKTAEFIAKLNDLCPLACDNKEFFIKMKDIIEKSLHLDGSLANKADLEELGDFMLENTFISEHMSEIRRTFKRFNMELAKLSKNPEDKVDYLEDTGREMYDRYHTRMNIREYTRSFALNMLVVPTYDKDANLGLVKEKDGKTMRAVAYDFYWIVEEVDFTSVSHKILLVANGFDLLDKEELYSLLYESMRVDNVNFQSLPCFAVEHDNYGKVAYEELVDPKYVSQDLPLIDRVYYKTHIPSIAQRNSLVKKFFDEAYQAISNGGLQDYLQSIELPKEEATMYPSQESARDNFVNLCKSPHLLHNLEQFVLGYKQYEKKREIVEKRIEDKVREWQQRSITTSENAQDVSTELSHNKTSQLHSQNSDISNHK